MRTAKYPRDDNLREPATAYPPPSSGGAHLRSSNFKGAGFLLLALGSTAAAAWLALFTNRLGWALAQIIFAFAFVQWFVLLHEAGHHTLFRQRGLNRLAGHIAALFALIPYESWQRIHARHHRWTGWQDLDATTAALVPRRLKVFERVVVNIAWKTYLPLFSVLYRIQNYWHLSRLRRYVSREVWRGMARNAVVLACIYVALSLYFGIATIAIFCGPGLFLSLMIQDLLLLSQHTHLPQGLSGQRTVQPYTPFEQEVFTRSLRLPGWLSWSILHFDAHELHHMYVSVPGYCLREIAYHPINEVHWWTWLRGVKRLRGDVFLFQNRDQTGFDL